MKNCMYYPMNMISISCVFPVAFQPKKKLDFDNIALLVAKRSGVTVVQMRSKYRDRPFVDARHIAMSLMIKYVHNTSDAMVSAYFKRHRTTVVHACGKVRDLNETDSIFRIAYDKLDRELEEIRRGLTE